MLWGAVVGIVVATVAGLFVALRLGGSLRRVGAATHRIAAGDYVVSVPVPPETEVAAIADGVNTLGRELAQTEGRRMRLLGEVAHEMRTPLTVIDGYVECMIDGSCPRTGRPCRTSAPRPRSCDAWSDDLSALSRAEEGRLTLDLQPLDLSEAVRGAAERLRPQTDDAGLDLVLDLAPAHAEGDPDRIAQVVTNLVGNALRATPPGGTVRVSTAGTPTGAGLTVSHTGEGLAADQLDKVFERFYRVPGRRAAGSESGSGIGLTIARGIARLHGGDLASSPGVGQGATFTLTLPVTSASGTPGS